MIIILEGPDGTGKSELAQELAKLTGWPVRHEVRTTSGLFYYTQLVQHRWKNTIFDRCYLGEAIYPQVLNDGRNPLHHSEVYMLEMALAAQGAILINCKLDLAEIKRNLIIRGDDLVSPSRVDLLVQWYDHYQRRSILPSLEYNYNVTDPKWLLERINLLYDKIYGNGLAVDFGATGFTYARPYMLVGDSINYDNKSAAPWFLPFTAATGCSTWFHRQLMVSGQRCYVTNSLGKDLQHEIKKVNPCKIIALGKLTQGRMKIPYEPCPHPQFLKRFKPNSSQLLTLLS